MKWIKLILKIAEWLLPGNAGKGKLANELEVAKETINILAGKLPPAEKGDALYRAASNLGVIKKGKKRIAKKWDKAKDRFWKKVFGD